MLDATKDNIYWFDNETGKCISELLIVQRIGQIKFNSRKNNRYFQVPKITNFNRLQWIASFIEMTKHEDKKFAKELESIIQGENPYQNFIKLLEEKEDEGWIYGWNSWEGDSAFEEMKKWFAKLPFEIKEEMDFFDDCPICQAMKEGKTSEKELKDAFREANSKNVLDDIHKKDKF